jgi:hypothetical protein
MSEGLLQFLRDTQQEVRSQMGEGSPYPEIAFAEVVMQHMAEIGMTHEPEACHFKTRINNATLRLSGFAMSTEREELDLFVSLYDDVDELTPIPDADTKTAMEQCLRFLAMSAGGTMAQRLDPTDDARALAEAVQASYDDLEQIRVFVLTDKVAKAKSFKAREIAGKSVRLEVMDIERLYRHWSEGKPRDELTVNFAEVSGAPIPCVFVRGPDEDYGYALAAVPGEALRHLYERFGSRLLEANVRSFLSVKGKGVNAGIQATLRNDPGRFLAYNNGIVVVADEIRFGKGPDGSLGIAWASGLQIVNGGQTTASIYFTKRKHPDTDLSKVFVPTKFIVMRPREAAEEEALISDISRYANSQNAVKQSDLSANKPFHVEVERLSLTTYCPDGVSRWFYERAAGSYATMLAREGHTPAKLRALKEAIPPSRRVTKTDLAKYINAWDAKPDIVSLGSQKNFDRFMASLAKPEGAAAPLPTKEDYKRMMAKAKLFRDAQKLVRPMFQAFQANITAYTVGLLAERMGDKIDLDRVWARQGPSEELLAQIGAWAREVNDTLRRTAGARMISEWAKRPECREAVLGARYSEPRADIPEAR